MLKIINLTSNFDSEIFEFYSAPEISYYSSIESLRF